MRRSSVETPSFMRREALWNSLAFRLFVLALCLSVGSYLIFVGGIEPELRLRLTLTFFAGPMIVVVLVNVYLWNTLSREVTWQEWFANLVLRLALWLVSFWQILCCAYLLLDWASGRGMMLWFPS